MSKTPERTPDWRAIADELARELSKVRLQPHDGNVLASSHGALLRYQEARK